MYKYARPRFIFDFASLSLYLILVRKFIRSDRVLARNSVIDSTKRRSRVITTNRYKERETKREETARN